APTRFDFIIEVVRHVDDMLRDFELALGALWPVEARHYFMCPEAKMFSHCRRRTEKAGCHRIGQQARKFAGKLHFAALKPRRRQLFDNGLDLRLYLAYLGWRECAIDQRADTRVQRRIGAHQHWLLRVVTHDLVDAVLYGAGAEERK